MKAFCLCVVLLVCSQLVLGANNPLGNCAGGRAVPYSLAASSGACSMPTIGIPPANVNEAYYAGGLQCGACYEVTGPEGTRVVQILDKCDNSTFRCSGDETQFGIDNTTFALIANRTEVDIIYDLGFREVTCDVTGNVQMEAVSAASGTINTYFSLVFWNFRVPVSDVRIQGKGWSTYDKLNRQGTSAVWAWNKRNNALSFPITIYLVGTTNEVISTQVSSLTQSATVDFGTQFTDVVGGNGLDCPMWTSGNDVYTDSVSTNWDTSYSFNAVSINVADTTDPYMGTDCISADLSAYGGLQFTRTGGFDPQYFSYLTFAAKSTGTYEVKVYMGDGLSGPSAIVSVNTSWVVYNISVNELAGTSTVESALAFQNNQNEQVQFFFDEISWVLNPVSPLENITQVTTTGYQFNESATSSPPVLLTTTSGTTGSTGFTFGSSDEPSSSAFSVVSNFASLVFVLIVLIVW